MSGLVLDSCALVDLESGQVRDDVTIAIEGDRIVSVGVDGAGADSDKTRLDAGGGFVIPGLINCHVHFGLVLPGAEGEALAGESESALALRMAHNAALAVAAGVTAVRLVGERPYADIALRASVAKGETRGPRIFTAGPLLISTGGHGWELGSCVEADGADGFRAAARKQLRAGTDLIKISVSGGLAGKDEEVGDSQMTRAETSAVTEVAHARGKKVAAHAGPAEVIAMAIECGVDTIEHGYVLTPDTATLMVERNTWLVPTINVSRAPHFYEKIGAPEWYREKARAAGEIHWSGLKAAIDAGVRIAMGTDMMPHEEFDGTTVTVREIEFYVQAGLTPLDALRAATVNAADLLGQPQLGRVAVGAMADLLILSRNPLEDITALRDIRTVVSRGAIAFDRTGGESDA